MKGWLQRLAFPATAKLTLNRMSANEHGFTNLQVYSKPEELTSSLYGKACDLSLSKSWGRGAEPSSKSALHFPIIATLLGAEAGFRVLAGHLRRNVAPWPGTVCISTTHESPLHEPCIASGASHLHEIFFPAAQAVVLSPSCPLAPPREP